MTRTEAVAAWLAVAGAAAFLAMAADKHAAVRGRRRIPERTLHALSLCGGWPGTLLAMALLRHKGRKGGFVLVTAGILVLYGAVAWLLACGPRGAIPGSG